MSGSTVQAAGALVWRIRREALQVLLVHRPRYQDWSWPKGKADPGESLAATAVREVAEETDQQIVLGLPLPGLHYPLADGRTKSVHYWAARATDDAAVLACRAPAVPAPDEVDDVAWATVDKAARMLTRKADRRPLTALVDAYASGRLATRPVLVVRHARAKRRSAWSGGEHDRPLTPTGHARSEALVPVLGAYGVTSVLSSPWQRCVQTLEPYAKSVGTELATADWLTEDAARSDPGRIAEEWDALLDGTGAATAVCTHRPVLPIIRDRLAARSRAWTLGTLPEADPYLRPGAVLVCHLRQRPPIRVVALEQVHPLLHG